MLMSRAGAVTIRAFNRTKDFAQTFQKQTDRYNRFQLYEQGLDCWLQVRSDLVGATVAFIVGLLALSGRLDPGAFPFEQTVQS